MRGIRANFSASKAIAVSENGSCREQARRKAGERAVQTGNETAPE